MTPFATMPDLSLPIHKQPTLLPDMSPFAASQIDEKREHPQRCHRCQTRNSWLARPDCENHDRVRVQQGRCHGSYLRRILVPTVAALLLTFCFLFALSCFYNVFDAFSWGADGFARRATEDAAGDNGGTFVDNKLYLIIVFVGLFLVVVLGIMLSAWCCRGVFENPLCCPCYLCACCGGLACLECIGCGLCAEA